MATVNIAYAADATITCDTTGLVPSATFVKFRESAWIDNTSTKYVDVLLMGTCATGATVTAATNILIYVVAAIGDGPEYPDVFDGTTSDEDLANAAAGSSFLKLAAVITVTNTSTTYAFGPVSVAQLFGGVMPNHWAVAITHNTNASAAAMGASTIRYLPITYTVA